LSSLIPGQVSHPYHQRNPVKCHNYLTAEPGEMYHYRWVIKHYIEVAGDYTFMRLVAATDRKELNSSRKDKKSLEKKDDEGE